METRRALLKEIFRTRTSKALTGALAFMAAYQFACDQFGAPTLPNLWGMTGATALPWWAWLLLAQLGFLYGLFEYVRHAHEPAPALGVKIQTDRIGTSELGRKAELSVVMARAATSHDMTPRGIEKAYFPIRAMMLTLSKEKGIKWPPATTNPLANLEVALRIMEQVAPLLKAGHDDEARQLSADLSQRLTPKGDDPA